MLEVLFWPTIVIITLLAIVGAGYLVSILLAYFLRWRDARSAQQTQQSVMGFKPPSRSAPQRTEGTGRR